MAHLAYAGYNNIKNTLPSEYTVLLADCNSCESFSKTLKALHAKKRNVKLLTAAQAQRLDQCVAFLEKENDIQAWKEVLQTGGNDLLGEFNDGHLRKLAVKTDIRRDRRSRSPSIKNGTTTKKQAAAGKHTKIRYTATVDKERFKKLACIIRSFTAVAPPPINK